MRARARRQGADDVPARERADQAPVLGDDRHGAFVGDPAHHRVETGSRRHGDRIAIEEARHGLAGTGGGEPVAPDAADEAALRIGHAPRLGVIRRDRRARLGHGERRRQDDGGPVRHVLGPHDRG